MRLIVEIDGSTHGSPIEIESDEERERHLRTMGYTVVRIHNTDGYDNSDGVLELISSALTKQAL